MNRRSILTKTGKGLMEATGKVSVSGLLKKFEKIPERELGETLRNLVRDGYVREFIGQQDGGPRAATGRPPAPQASEGAGGDLDFTDFTPLKPSPKASEDERLQAQAREIARQAQAMRTREEAAAKTKAKTQASTEAEERDRREVEQRVRREAEERVRREEAERVARIEAETRAKVEAEMRAKREFEERARREEEERR